MTVSRPECWSRWRTSLPIAAATVLIALAIAMPLPTAASGSGSRGDSLARTVSADPADPIDPQETVVVPQKVALIVGPVGEELTPVYIEIAEAAAASATEQGATVARAYSPEATPENVIAAVEDANIVVYLGHGAGFPNPYSDNMDPATVNGFGLQGPNAGGDHSDSWQDGTLKYYGEAWLAANARPAPGWVMIHSNVCYAPGAGEAFDAPAEPEVAAARVANYSRAPLLEMGAGAYFATDFYKGAAEITGAILARPDSTFGEIFASESRYQADAVSRVPHALVPGSEIWLQRSAYFEGKVDYWYAFSGSPDATPASVAGTPAQVAADGAPGVAEADETPAPAEEEGVVTGIASHYLGDPAFEGQPTVNLPLALGGGPRPGDPPKQVVICGDRCVMVLVVDACDCLAGTPEARVVNLSQDAWQIVTDRPLSDGLVEVTLYLGHHAPAPAATAARP